MLVQGMRVVSEAAIVAACFSAAFAILWYIRNRRGLNPDNKRAGYLLFACFFSCGLSQLADVSAYAWPNLGFLTYVEAVLVAASLTAGLAVWPMLPALASLPTTQDLERAKAALERKEHARGALMDRLTDANRELERRVSERTFELRSVNRRFEAALTGSTISVAQQDRDLRYTWAYNMPGGLEAERVVGARSADFMPADRAAALDAAKQRAIDAETPVHLEISAEIDGGVRWFEERIEPLSDGNAVIGVISTSVDVTVRKRHEIELTTVLRELTHRSKNLLAVVQGIARQTGQSCDSVQQFNERFAARLQALSLAHELLVATSWRPVDLRTLVETVLAHVAPERAAGIAVDGPDIRVSAERAQSLAIGLHEMATNAVSYGGLSRRDGALGLGWSIAADAGDAQRVDFYWRERGALQQGQTRGFGISFVEKLLPRALAGRSTLLFDSEGLTWKMSFPLER